jgi:2-polyprenyl-6-hydroxyphenyl methylase/3-demethylubiquinone-9 3-methyltransferase
MQVNELNIDVTEQAKFDALADAWWDPDGPLRTLHHINPLRLSYIRQFLDLKGKRALDVGCGGGLLTEALARNQAVVSGLDISTTSITAAVSHADVSGLEIEYTAGSVEEYAGLHPGKFDVITCMELLEHVPDISSLINACSVLLKPGGHLFIATINRSPASYLSAILFAEYLLHLLPRGTHEYARFVRPSELNKCLIRHRIGLVDVTGMIYLPVINKCAFTRSPSVNYLAYATRRYR